MRATREQTGWTGRAALCALARRFRSPALALWLALGAVGACFAETVYLRDGNIVTGDVLARKHEFIALDVGFTIIEIPNKEILRIEEAQPGQEDTQREGAGAATEGLLYREAADLPVRPVKELVAQFGEGVLLVRTPAGLGSGFIIHEDGYFITNAHVIQGETTISATLFIQEGDDFSRRKGDDVQIVAVNPFMDLALLKLKAPDGLKLTPLYFGDMDSVRTGDPVFAIGNPFGFERTVSEGIVSTKARAAAGIVLIQTTAPINPGNSGGPLLNARGEVIGVTNMKIGIFAEAMGFAVPIDVVKDFLKFREAFAYDRDNPNTGHHYLSPPHRPEAGGGGEDDG